MAKKDNSANVQSAENRRRQLAQAYSAEEKVPVSISPLYKPHFGNTMAISINGISVYVPCDGKTYRIPESFAVECLSRIGKVDKILEKKNRMRDISSNFERSPGELALF